MVKILLSKERNLPRTAYKQCKKCLHCRMTNLCRGWSWFSAPAWHLPENHKHSSLWTWVASCGEQKSGGCWLMQWGGLRDVASVFLVSRGSKELVKSFKTEWAWGPRTAKASAGWQVSAFLWMTGTGPEHQRESFFKDYFYSTLSKALGHSWIKDALQTNEPGGGLFSFLWADGFSYVLPALSVRNPCGG